MMSRSCSRKPTTRCAQPAPHRADHARHGLGHRDGRHAAGLRRRLRPGVRQYLRQLRHQAGHRGAGQTSMQAGGQKAGAPVRFTQDDVDTLPPIFPRSRTSRPKWASKSTVQYDNRVFTFPVTGNYPNVFEIRSLKLDQGRFYNMEDQVQRARVAVIGSEAKDKLFSGRNALGEHIRLDGLSFEVVGVLAAKMQEGNDDINRVVYIPFSTMSDLKRHALSGHDLVQLSDARIRADGASGARRFWPRSTSSTRPTGRRCECST